MSIRSILAASLFSVTLLAAAQQISDPSDASATSILKSSREVITKLNEFKIMPDEMKFNLTGSYHKYSTQCEYIKTTSPHDYYVVEFVGKCAKNEKHPAYEMRAEVHYRRSNSANSCKLDNVWKHCATEVWSPVANELIKASTENLNLLIEYFKKSKEPFLFRIDNRFNDIVNVKNLKIIDKIEWNGTVLKTEMLSATKKLNLAKCDIIVAKFNDDKSAILRLQQVQTLVKFITETVNGVTTVKSYDNLSLGTAEDYIEIEIFKSTELKPEYDSLFAGYKTVGFEKIYNRKENLPKLPGLASTKIKAKEDFIILLKDVLSNGKTLNKPERMKEFLYSKYENSYENFIAMFSKMENDGYGWGNLRVIDETTLKYDYFGTKLLTKKNRGDRNISLSQFEEKGKHVFGVIVH